MLRPNYSKNNDDLIVQLNDWVDSDVVVDDDDSSSSEDEYGNKKKKWFKEKKYVIRAYGITEDGHSISINITDFTPFFFIEVPKGWNRLMVKLLKNKIQSRVNKWSVNSLISFTVVERIPFYGFCNNEQSFFIKLVFKNLSGFYSYKKAVNQTSENPIRIRDVDYDVSKLLYETKVTPLLRFFHSNDLKPVGWVKIPRGHYKHNFSKKTRCQIDCTVSYKNVQPYDLTKIGKFVVASFDIECTSGDGSFPDADKKDDKIIQIGTTVNIFGDDKIYKHIVTLKKCAKIEGAIVEEYENEKQLLLGWCNFIKQVDPDVLTGYNIWGFDWKYIYQRAGNGNGGQCAPYQEALLKKLSKANPDDRGKVGAKFVEKELQSSALGQNFLYYIQIDGIVQVDLYKLIQKDYNLVSYKLNSVCEHFMGQNKEDLTPNQLFRNFKRGTPEDIREIATYCIQDNVLCTNLINKLKVIPKNVAMGNVCCIPFSYLFLRGQGIKIFSLVIKRCTQEGFLIKNLSPEDIDANSYEGAIVFIPEPGLYLEPVAVMDFASLYPSSMIAENISHDSIVGFLEYYLKPKKNKNDPDEYELKKDTIRKEYEGLPDYEYIDIKYDIYQGKLDEKKRVGYKICRYAERKDGKKAVLPRILMDLLKARRDTRSKIKYKHGVAKDGKEYVGLLKEEDGVYEFKTVEGVKETVNKEDIVELRDEYSEFDKENLDGQQLAFKVTCNSLYGQVGATTSPICFKELAASTTATGRLMVTYARDYTLEKYQGSKLVYGDTDSVFINFTEYIRNTYAKNYKNNQIDDREMMRLTIEVGKEAGAYVTTKLKKPQDLEYEKVFWPFMIFSKKRYVGNKYEYSPDKFKQTSMGIVLKRRDNAPIVKDIYGGIIDFLLNKRNVPGAYDFFRKEVQKLLDGKVDISRLVISKSLKANYKNPTTIPHKMLADRMGERDPGNKPQSNDRVPYCFIDVCNLKCKKCNVKIDKKDCKCVKCMNLFCKRHIKDHAKMCKNVCRFCKMPEKELADGTMSIKMCNICKGYYCKKCFQKHKLKENTKTGEITYDKCKKPLSTKLIQGDIVEEPAYIKDKKLKIDYMYYLERQIENPVLQMFGLIRKDPENIIKDIKRKFLNKQNGRKSIESFFGSSRKCR